MNSPLYYNTLRNDGLPSYEDLFPFHSSYLVNAHREHRYVNYVDTCRQHRRVNYVDSMYNAQKSARKAASKKKIKGLKKAVGVVIDAIFG